MDHRHKFYVIGNHPYGFRSEKIWFYCEGCGVLCSRPRESFYSAMLKKKPKWRIFGRKNK
jgi:hypothetical protein